MSIIIAFIKKKQKKQPEKKKKKCNLNSVEDRLMPN